ncbi:MAG: hypothetical protein COS15_02505 [Caldiserica bacterium CG02_land_8_20_14_3_00_36_38]|nr:hypothetical protein [Caldisericota bacterium]NCQ52665.1 hypothetical protein [Caldisericota bacterium]PIV55992.1 MAG: hypothetical protein COS15_02505 [Caldiserica bacterium CG02_land_8_20_14_3_00_36_38]
MNNKEIIEEIKKIKTKEGDIGPRKEKIRRKIILRFEKEKRHRQILRRFVFACLIPIVLILAFIPLTTSRSNFINLKEGKIVIPKIEAFAPEIEHINTSIKGPYVYDGENKLVWFIKKDNNLYSVALYDILNNKKIETLSPSVDNMSNINGGIALSQEKVIAGVGDHLYVIDRRTKEVLIIELPEESLPREKKELYPIKAIVSLNEDFALISRADSKGITEFNATSLRAREIELPSNIDSPAAFVKGGNLIYFLAKDIRSGKQLVGSLDIKSETVKILKDFSPVSISANKSLFALSKDGFYKIDTENNQINKINADIPENAKLVSYGKFIYAVNLEESKDHAPERVNKISVAKYDPDKNILYEGKIITGDNTPFLLIDGGEPIMLFNLSTEN